MKVLWLLAILFAWTFPSTVALAQNMTWKTPLPWDSVSEIKAEQTVPYTCQDQHGKGQSVLVGGVSYTVFQIADRLVSARIDKAGEPEHIWFAKVDPNGTIRPVQDGPYDPDIHISPCQWLHQDAA